MESETRIDITGRIGDMFPIQNPEWPMYSFGRPAYILWNEIANALVKKGWTEDEIKYWLQSKDTRWALDWSLGDMIREVAIKYAEGISK